MKKKLLFTLFTAVLFICLFVAVVGAQAQSYSSFGVTLTDGTSKTVYTPGSDQWEGRVYLTAKLYAEAPLDTEGTYEEIAWSSVKVLDFSGSMIYIYDSKNQVWNEKAYGSNQGNTALCVMRNGIDRSQCTSLEKIITGKIVTVRGATFGEFPALKEVVISKNTKELQYNTFERNPLLEKVTFEDGGILSSMGNQVFIACPKLTSVSLPNTLTSMGGSVFESCTSLVSVDWPTSISTIPGSTFKNCKSLPNYTIPSHVTRIEGSAFNGCTSFTEINIPSTVEYIGSDCWRGCTGVTKITIDPDCPVTHIYAHTFDGTRATEITLPNSVQQIGQSNFNSGTYVTINLGASFVGFQASNGTQPPFALGSSLKYIYLSDTFDCVRDKVFSWNDNNANEYNKNYIDLTFFYTGTKEQAEAIVASAKDVNTYIATMTVISASDYAKAVADGTLVTGVSGTPARYIVYGYNKCEAFYGGEHTISSDATVKFEGEDYVSRYISVCACTRGCGEDAVSEICGPLFVNKGYSVYEENGKGNITFGIYTDEKNVEAYEAYTNTKVTFGFVVGKEDTALNGEIFDQNGACLVNGAICTDFATIDFKSFSIYNLKLTGIATDANKAQNMYCGAYVIDGASVSYIGDSVTKKSIAVSYNSLLEAQKDEQ